MKLPIPALHRSVPQAVSMLAATMLASCSHMPLASSSSSEAATSRGMMPAPAALGTAWGESRDSRVTDTTFERAHQRPDGIGELYYANTTQAGSATTFRGPREVIYDKVSMGLKDGRGNWLSGIVTCGRVSRPTVFGKEGERYEIVVRNLTRTPIEAVVSVDGLDVLDGRSASFSKRGYIIGPRGTMTIPGWRTSSDAVAAFRFATVADSYAAKKHGDTRNVGVIGVAAFTPKTPPARVFAEPPPPDRRPNPFPGER